MKKKGLGVEIRNGEDFARALRVFTRKVQNSGKLRDFSEKQQFVSNTEKRKLARKKMEKRAKKKQK